MSSTVIQGKLTHVRHATETSGHISHGAGQISSSNAWSFRVGNRAATFKSRGGASIGEGDVVTAAGHESKGTFKVLALRNETTGSVHAGPGTLFVIMGGLVTLMGIPFMLIGIGFAFVAIGLYYVWTGLKQISANNALDATPVTS